MDDLTLKLLERVPILQKDNWPVWKFKMELALRQLNLWSVIDSPAVVGGGAEPNQPLNEKSDEKVRCLLGLWTDESFVDLIGSCTTAQDMWQALAGHFKPNQTEIAAEPNSVPEANVSGTSQAVEPVAIAPAASTSAGGDPISSFEVVEEINPEPGSVNKSIDTAATADRNSKPKPKCTFCGKKGHLEKKCWEKKKASASKTAAKKPADSPPSFSNDDCRYAL